LTGIGLVRSWGGTPSSDVDAALAELLVSQCAHMLLLPEPTRRLSPREQEVLGHLVDGAAKGVSPRAELLALALRGR
jgi:hypothetical protein